MSKNDDLETAFDFAFFCYQGQSDIPIPEEDEVKIKRFLLHWIGDGPQSASEIFNRILWGNKTRTEKTE